MSGLRDVRSVVFPARDLATSIEAWTHLLGREPTFQTADFALFANGGVDLGLSRLPWVDYPLVFWTVEDIEKDHRALIAAGATPMVEIEDGSLAELGTAIVTNGDPATGIVDVSGARMAVLNAGDGNLIGIEQELPMNWADSSE